MAYTRTKDDDVAPEKLTRQQARAQTRADDKLLKKALECFRQSNDADDKQRRREIDDLDFDAGNHWPVELLESRGPVRDPVSGKMLPGRPSLIIPKLDGPIQQVVNTAQMASLGIKVKPRTGGATKKTAERINGLIRFIQTESRAQIARIWAYQRAVKCGRGYYRILKEWANDGDWDVDLIVDRILNQSSVYLDPFHKQPDASDTEWGFVVEDLPYKRFKREHGDSRIALAGQDELRGVGDESPGWVTFSDNGEIKAVRRAEYFYVVYTERNLIELEGGWKGFEDADDRPKRGGGKVVRERVVRQRKVKWVKMTATEILERADWEGRYIPIVQVLGREYNVNGKRIYKGMISNGKDAQRSYNYMRSKQVEAVGLAPIAPYVMAEGQDEGYEEMWATANVMPYAALKYKPVTVGGHPAPAPQRISASTDIGAITMAAQAADEDIKSITGYSDPSLGRSNPADRSGRAIAALQQRTDQGTSDYFYNLTEISMVHEGRILVDMLPHVYDREGRIAEILDDDLQTSHQVMLNRPFKPGPDGEPMEVQPGTPGAELIDLRKGVYRVVVAVGKNHKVQQDESVELLGELIAANPQTAPLVTDVLVENIDAPGFPRLAKRFKAMLPPQIQQMEAQDAGEQMPPHAAAALAQMQGQMQQMGQQMQQMAQVIEQKRVEAEAKAEVERYRVDREYELKMAEQAMKERIEIEKLRAGMTKAEIDAAAKRQTEELRAVTRRVEQEHDLRHEAISEDTRMAHEAAQADLDRDIERQKVEAQKAAAKKRAAGK